MNRIPSHPTHPVFDDQADYFFVSPMDYLRKREHAIRLPPFYAQWVKQGFIFNLRNRMALDCSDEKPFLVNSDLKSFLAVVLYNSLNIVKSRLVLGNVVNIKNFFERNVSILSDGKA